MCQMHYYPLCWNLHQTPKDSHGCLMLTVLGLAFLPLAKVFIIKWAPTALELLSETLE